MPTANRRASTPSLLTQVNDREISESEILTNGGTEKRTKPQHKVSFNENVLVRTCLHINDYCEEELKACWYRRSELSKIKAEFAPTLIMWKRNCGQLPHHLCFRGLENRVKECSIQRKHAKVAALLCVLGKQLQRQQQSNQATSIDLHVEEVAALYSQKSRRSRKTALALAAKDEEVAQHIYQKKKNNYGERNQKKDKRKKKKKKNQEVKG
eukprot:CAMPEP_0202458514 /NCGR_PEP_ID=MMETSP1360-20130828/26321_1 /ASSEMBLY_ACC=CAM_ASM_000848 /TAXON_ID=515479 /ORGANISM="Licmophora paradoxa, Strain CCMP2313" /LENGTH=210 /DNA_ID=CAMNT_0049079099 /DNA_START=128 /DNA_END=761 /DNA_ORIENTATION=+